MKRVFARGSSTVFVLLLLFTYDSFALAQTDASDRLVAKMTNLCPRGSEDSGCPRHTWCSEPGGPSPPRCHCLQCTGVGTGGGIWKWSPSRNP